MSLPLGFWVRGGKHAKRELVVARRAFALLARNTRPNGLSTARQDR